MTLKDIILGTIGAVGLAGSIYGFNGILRSEINEVETPAVQRIRQINEELAKIKGNDLVRDENLQNEYLSLKGEYDTFISKPLVREELQRHREVYREFNRDYVLTVLFGLSLAIPIGYYITKYKERKKVLSNEVNEK